MFRSFTAAFFFLIFLLVPAFGAPSQAQVNAALGSRPGLNWTVTGDWWTVGQYSGLTFNPRGPEEIGTLQSSVAGPALLVLTTSGFDAFDVFISIDGVQSGPKTRTRDTVQNRVVIPSGTHTVHWKISRRFANPSADRNPISFGVAELETYSVVPLQGAAAGPGIVLGGDNWIGQNRWHAGDGAAAWSGDRDGILSANIQGPGMVSFKVLENGARGLFRINGGAWEELPRSRDPGYWVDVNRYATAGNHVFEWKCLNADHEERVDGELVIDEIKLLPEVETSAALNTPQWSWNVDYPAPGPGFPMGAPTADAEGGTALIAAESARISTNVTLPRGLILTRAKRQDFQSVSNSTFVGERLIFSDVTEGPHYKPGWFTAMAEIKAGTGRLSIELGAGLVLDSIKFIAAPETPAATLGMQEGAFIFGGGGTWQISPLLTEGRYALMPLKSAGITDGWIDVPVTGPAEFSMRFRDVSARPALTIQVNGQTLWTPFYSGINADLVKVELPSGNHVVRVSCDLRAGYLQSGIQFSDFSIGPLGTGEKSALLEKAGPWLSTGSWKAATRNKDGQDALSPVDPSPDQLLVNGKYVTRSFWEGPGYASAWFYQPSSTPAASARTGWEGDLAVPTAVSQIPNGWRKETFWVPPGRHAVGIAAFGNAVSVNDLAVDSLAFAADTVIPLGQALGGGSFQWTTDPDLPWTGLQRGSTKEALAVSRVVPAGGTTRLSTKVFGPGTISFRWRRGGVYPSTGPNIPAMTANGERFGYLWGNDQSPSFQINGDGPLTLEWTNSGTAGFTEWLELSNVVWTPLPGKPLAEVLDGGSAVSWSTSGDPAFLGRDNSFAVNGSAAHTTLAPGAEAWLEAVVTGPGIFDFKLLEIPSIMAGWVSKVSCEVWVDNMKTGFSYGAGQPLMITGSGTHRVRLRFRNPTADTISGAVDQVLWTPLPGKPLADVLDAGSGITWITSESPPFVGQNNSLAANGSAAHTTLGAGGTGWLESRVTGPGTFNFKLLENPAVGAGWVSNVSCEVWVDGVKNDFFPNADEPLWITGGGAHQIRLKFHNPTTGTISGAVDQVTWRALTTTASIGWTASHTNALSSYSSGGKGNAAVIIFNTTPGQEKWIERTVIGPGQLEWDLNRGRGEAEYTPTSTLKMELDGAAAVPLNIYGWKRYRLAVPVGTHRIRWTSAPPASAIAADGESHNHLWWISKPTFTSGTPAFVNALDLPSVNWMLVGEDNPTILTGGSAWDRSDAMSLPVTTQLLYWNTSSEPLRMQGMLTRPAHDIWETRSVIVPAGTLFEWGVKNRQSPISGATKADKVEVFPISLVPITDALNTSNDIYTGGWIGITSTSSSADGADVA